MTYAQTMAEAKVEYDRQMAEQVALRSRPHSARGRPRSAVCPRGHLRSQYTTDRHRGCKRCIAEREAARRVAGATRTG